MIQQTEILGAHAWFFRNGTAFTVPGAGTASRTSKPGAADTGWYDLGILDIGLAPKMEEKEIWRAAPAVKELEDVIPYKRGLDIKLKKKELGVLDFELVLGCLALDLDPENDAGQFNPLSLQGGSLKGWLKFEYFGIQSGRAGDNPLLTADGFVYLKYDGDFEPGDEPLESAWLCRLLRSPLNTGALA